MYQRLHILFLVLSISTGTYAQARLPTPFPTAEKFVDAVFHTVVDSAAPHYYLLAGTDSGRFVTYDYDEWADYHLLESVPVSILNELAEKVYQFRSPYFWRQDSLTKAICVTRRQADSILYQNPPGGDGSGRHLVFSFSLPQFTDDGQYAVIDLNMVCGGRCGLGSTYIFRRTGTGWKMIGVYRNWSA